MVILFRKIFFYTFVLIYLLFCPVIIMNALGIVIKPGWHKPLQQTGLISLNTIPPGATVTINGRLQPDLTPTMIRELPEGDYAVHIALKGYRPWDKTVPVRKKQATPLENILLLPEQFVPQTVTSFDLEKIIPVPHTPFLILQKSGLAGGLYRYTLPGHLTDLSLIINATTDKRLTALFQKDSLFAALPVSAVWTEPQSRFIVLQLKGPDTPVTLWTDLQPDPPLENDISKLILTPTQTYFWDPQDGVYLSTLNEGSLSVINLKEKSVSPGIANQVKGAAFLDNQLYLLSERLFSKMNPGGIKQTPLTGKLHNLPADFQSITRCSIQIISDRLFVFLTSEGALMTNRLPYRLIDRGVKEVLPLPGKNKIAIWTKNSLGTIDFSSTVQEGIFEIGPDIQWLVQDGKDIQQAFWVSKGSHILFRDQNTVRLVETQSFGDAIKNDIIKTAGDVYYDDGSGLLFFLDSQDSKLSSLVILPDHPLFSFKLPEGWTLNKETKNHGL